MPASLTIASAGAFPLFAAVALILTLAGLAVAFLLPNRRVRIAEQAAAEALAKVDATSYLEFQLRRLDAVLDPGAKQRLEDAVAASPVGVDPLARARGRHQRPSAPRSSKTKSRSTRRHSAGWAVPANEIEGLRNDLAAATSRAEYARRQLIEACRPYGADDPGAAMEQVRQRIATGRIGRLQWDLEEAERALAALEVQADHLCTTIGVAPSDEHRRSPRCR